MEDACPPSELPPKIALKSNVVAFAAIATVAATTNASRNAFFPRLGYIDPENATVNILAVEGSSGSLRFLG